MKRILLAIALCLTLFPLNAQRRFDAKKFQADLEQYIVQHAALTPQQAAVFFPLYREKMGRQRAFFGQIRRYKHVDVSDEKASEQAIHKVNEANLAIKRLDVEYDQKFLGILPASKVVLIHKAEDKFHRQAFHRAAKRK